MYKLIFEKRALQELNKLEGSIKRRIWNKLQECKERPFGFLKPLVQIRGFKLRVGDYRIILSIKRNTKIINVLKIGLRKNIYN